MRAVEVARVSTEEQKDAGNSLPAQSERIKNYCARKDFDIAASFSFDESAYKTKRDEFDKLLTFVEEAIKKEKLAVCFDKVDRLSRSVFDKRVARLYELAIADKIELHFVSDGQVINAQMSAVEKFQFGMSLGLAKYYSDAISDNVKRAFEQKRRKGEWTGPAPLGYLNIALDAEKRLRKDIVLDTERAHLIERLFLLYATGNYSITTVHEEITRLGLRNRDGSVLARSNIEFMLKNPFYYGFARPRKGAAYPHRYKTIISRELFDRVQSVFASRHKATSKPLSDTFIFKGLLHCDHCGCVMSPEIKKGRFIYYSCTNAKGTCKRVYVREEELLKPVQDVFKTFEQIPVEVETRLLQELRDLNESEVEYHKKEMARIRAEHDRVQNLIDGYMDMLADKSITKDDYDKKLEKLKDRQYRLNIEAEEHIRADHDYKLTISHVFSMSRRMGAIFAGSEVPEKRAILNFLLQNPRVSDKKLVFTMAKPFDAILELANCPTGLLG